LLAEKKAKGPGRRGAQTLKDLGAAPDGKPIKVLKGKFGPYVSDGETNATLPEGTEPDSVTMEQALALIAERAAKGGKKKKAKAAPKAKAEPKAKAAAEKTNGAEKKTAAKSKSTTNKKKAASAPKAQAKAPSKSQGKPKAPQGKPKVPELAGE
jgi:DNA topoisomerase-1